MGLRVVTGELVEPASINAAKDLDKRIRECLRDYVQLGKLLMEMRDNQAYRLVGPYDTFEEYCKDVEGLAWSTAKEKILAYLVHKAIEDNLGANILAPGVETQVRQLFIHDNAIARFKTQKRIVTTKDGDTRTVEVPVAVANPKKVAEQWANTVKAYEAAVAKSQKAHQAKIEHAKEMGLPEPAYRRPKLTGAFVVNELPREYQPARQAASDCHPFIKWVGQVLNGVEQFGVEGRWEKLIADPYRKKLPDDAVEVLRANIRSAVTKLNKIDREIESEFCK